jgi:hypothetical protein
MNLALGVSSVMTEADVELKVVTPLLTNPNYLAIPIASIKGKTYLAPTVLDKKAGKTGGYYPDFSAWELGFVVLIVEAKEPNVPVEVGFREGCLYARHLNADYKSGVNPCHFVLSCNGKQLAYGAWDSNQCQTIEVDALQIGSNELETLIRFCHHRVLLTHAAKCLSAVRLSRSTQPYTLAGDRALITSKKAFNSFAAELAPTLRRYFTSVTQNNDPDIYQRAYVGSDDITQYDRILESLLKDRLTPRRPLFQELSPTRAKEPKLAKAIATYRDDRPPEGQLQVITGSVGTGKSLFARRYKELLQPEEQRKSTHWAFIDFNGAPEPIEEAHDWLCERFIESFRQENPRFDPFANENLTRIFSQDLQRKRGIYDEIKKKISAEEAERKARRTDVKAPWCRGRRWLGHSRTPLLYVSSGFWFLKRSYRAGTGQVQKLLARLGRRSP